MRAALSGFTIAFVVVAHLTLSTYCATRVGPGSEYAYAHAQ